MPLHHWSQRHAQTNIPVSALQSMCGSIYVELASWRDAKKQMSRSTVQVIKNEGKQFRLSSCKPEVLDEVCTKQTTSSMSLHRSNPLFSSILHATVLKLSNDDVRSLIAAIPWRPSNVWELPPWQPQGTTKDMPRFEPPEIPNGRFQRMQLLTIQNSSSSFTLFSLLGCRSYKQFLDNLFRLQYKPLRTPSNLKWMEAMK